MDDIDGRGNDRQWWEIRGGARLGWSEVVRPRGSDRWRGGSTRRVMAMQ